MPLFTALNVNNIGSFESNGRFVFGFPLSKEPPKTSAGLPKPSNSNCFLLLIGRDYTHRSLIFNAHS